MLPGEDGPIGAPEFHLHRPGLVGDAAALVRADPAVFGPVRLRAGATREGEILWLFLPVYVETFFPRLEYSKERSRDDREVA